MIAIWLFVAVDENSVNLQDAIFLDNFSKLRTTFQNHPFVTVKVLVGILIHFT